MTKQYKLIHPPKEIFLNEDLATWDWDYEGLSEKYDTKNGIRYYPEQDSLPLNGFPFPPATENISIFKRALIIRVGSFKNPFLLLFYKRFLRELEELSLISVQRYYLKPDMYCQSVRELYRVGKKLGLRGFSFSGDSTKNGDWVQNICSIFQWDTGWRWRVQNIFNRLDKESLKKNPSREFLRVLKIGFNFEESDFVAKKWLSVLFLARILLIFPRIRRIIRIVADKINPEEFEFDESDIRYAFKSWANVR